MRNIIYILIVFFNFSLFTFLPVPQAGDLFAQSITWERIYNGPGNNMDGFRSICKADGDNMYVVGYSWITGSQKRMYVMKLNAYGDTIWAKIIGDNSAGGPVAEAVVASGDGGCVFTGSWDSAFTVKLSSTGNIVWLKKYASGNIILRDIKKSANGGYIACGSFVDVNFDGYVLKIDSAGNLEWEKVYPSLFFKVFYSVEIAHDGGYILVGSKLNFSTDYSKGFVTKINSNGDTLWNRTFSLDTLTSAEKIIKVNNGYLIGGNLRHVQMFNYSRMFFYRIDVNGDSILANIINSPKDEYLCDIKVINKNKYIMSGSSDSALLNNLNGRIWITDSNGNILKEKILPSPGYIVLCSVLPLANGDIVIAGEADMNINPYNDAYAVRLDNNLNYTPIGVTGNSNIVPDKFVLYQNYPNPFNPKTSIKYEIPKEAQVILRIYDITGREILQTTEYKQAGSYSYTFDGTNYASGLYLYKLETGNYVETKKMLLIK